MVFSLYGPVLSIIGLADQVNALVLIREVQFSVYAGRSFIQKPHILQFGGVLWIISQIVLYKFLKRIAFLFIGKFGE